MIWKIPKIWEGDEVWIFGGGPSITEQFEIPAKVVKKVIEGGASPSIYSDYMKAIHHKHIIGINVAYRIGDWMDIIFFGDDSFFLAHKKNLAEYPGLKVTCYPNHTNCDWVKYLGRDGNKSKGITSNTKCVSWNSNSGAAAINLAVHMGAKRIILLGFDMQLGSDNITQHWHDLYNRREQLKNPRGKKQKQLPFDKHLLCFPEIAKDAKRLGVTILNASPNSVINVFPKVTVKELLK